MNQRNETFDIMKGIGIIAVVIGHMRNVPMPIRTFIFSFHMPLFFILAGYFFKPNYNYQSKIRADFSRLVIPYIFTASILLLYNIFQAFIGDNINVKLIELGIVSALFGSGSGHSSLIWGKKPAIGAIWFLLALFWCRVIYNYIACKTKQKYIIAGFVAILATLIDRYLINLPLAILPGLSGMMFYLIGDWLKSHRISYYLIFLCLICWIISICSSHIWMVQCHYGIYPIDVLGACGGTAFIYWISKYCAKIKLNLIFVWFGINSLVILCFHLIELNCHLCAHLHIPNIFYYQFPVKLIFCVLMTWLCYKFAFTRHIFALKQ